MNILQKLLLRRWYACVTKASLDQWGKRMMDTVFIKAGKSRQRFWNLGPSDDTVRTTRRFSLTVLGKKVRSRVRNTSKYHWIISLHNKTLTVISKVLYNFSCFGISYISWTDAPRYFSLSPEFFPVSFIVRNSKLMCNIPVNVMWRLKRN